MAVLPRKPGVITLHWFARAANWRLIANRKNMINQRKRVGCFRLSFQGFARRDRRSKGRRSCMPQKHKDRTAGAIPMNLLRPSRREVMRASVIGGIAVYLAPLGSRAFAALFEDQLLTRPAWNDGVLKYRVDGTSKVPGGKVLARDIRARDMPDWPQQQSHALVLRVTMADRGYAGFDLSALGPDLAPDRVVTAADLARDGLTFPDFYGEDILLPEGKTPAYLGQAVAILIYQDFV